MSDKVGKPYPLSDGEPFSAKRVEVITPPPNQPPDRSRNDKNGTDRPDPFPDCGCAPKFKFSADDPADNESYTYARNPDEVGYSANPLPEGFHQGRSVGVNRYSWGSLTPPGSEAVDLDRRSGLNPSLAAMVFSETVSADRQSKLRQ
jgi:hypothetical protein